MLDYPGRSFNYNGRSHVYPRIELIYWAGGNPFHHHQDLARLVAAWRRVPSVIVHEQFWTATARMPSRAQVSITLSCLSCLAVSLSRSVMLPEANKASVKSRITGSKAEAMVL